MMGLDRQTIMRKLLSEIDIEENDQINAAVDTLAEFERSRHANLAAHLDALDVEIELPALKPKEQRVEELTALVEAKASGDAWGYWVDHQAPDALENPDRAEQYAGMDRDEWDRRLSKWAELYRDRREDLANVPDREVAEVHVESRYGVDLATFERTVVEWSPAETMETAVAGPTTAMNDALYAATQEVRR